MESQEIQLENTVIQPTNVPVERNDTTHCFFCKTAFQPNQPCLQLACLCKFHTSCFLERRVQFDEDFYLRHLPLLEDVQLSFDNHCPNCRAILLNIDQYLEEGAMDRALQRVDARTVRRKTTFMEKYQANKQMQKDMRLVKKSITFLRKNYRIYDKKQKELSKQFQTEIGPLKSMMQQVRKKYLAQVPLLAERKQWMSARAKFVYARRKFERDYQIADFYQICSFKELRLPSRWTMYSFMNGGRRYRRHRMFGCRI